MAGTVLENISNRKLLAMVLGLVILEIVFIVLGGVLAPRPTMSQLQTAINCASTDSDWVLPDTCHPVNLEDEDNQYAQEVGPNNVVFSVIIPLKGRYLIRWFQYLLTLAMFEIPYHKDRQIADNPEITMNIRLGYSDDPSSFKHSEAWSPLVEAVEKRPIDCIFEHPKTEKHHYIPYNCDPVFLFQLGSIPHKYYLLNIRLPVNLMDPAKSPNMGIGKVTNLNIVSISQTGGFTKIWISLKVALCTIMVFPVIWYWRRVLALARPAFLIEKAIFGLAIGMEFLNLPLELISIFTDASWMLLFIDIRQGLFYAVLFGFWVIFTGEHLMDQAHRNKLSAYKWHLACISSACLAFLGFELGERGTQLLNPTSTIWKHPTLGMVLLVVGCIAGVAYFLLLCYLVFRVFRSIRFKRRFILQHDRTAHFQKIVNRFRILMLLSIGTAGLTIAFFVLEQKLEGVMDHYLPEGYKFNPTSGFFTGVYGLWNIYVFLVLSLYAPSHKNYITTDPDDDATDQEVVALNNGSEQIQLMHMVQEKEREE